MSAKKRGKKAAGGDPYREREQAKYDRPIASREFITSVLRAEKGPVDFEALAEKLNLDDDANALEALRRRVGAMLRDGQLIQNRKRGLVPVDTDALIAGRISAHPDGFGFVIADDGDKDVYLNGKQMRQVLHGDRVVVCITGIDHRGRREGRIVDVVERANKSLVGRLSIDRGTVVVLPDNKRIHQDLLVAPGELADAEDGDMVVAQIIEQPTRRHQPVGKIVEVLGQHLRPGMEIDVALHSHGIPVEWPDEVMEQSAAFSTTVNAAAAKGRKDVRDLPLITIDGADARDFDDAVWCERLEKGWRLLVAIADVAHYVSPGSPLDIEAVERGTSVYFPGRVVPMLPEVLSNGLCSLNPDVDRLCMLCEMTLDEKANVKKTRFHNGILRSHARLTYDQVSEMLTDSHSGLRKQYEPVVPVIEELYGLYKALAKKRRTRGAIEFGSTETHIIFDDNKKIREIIPITRNDAHKLIEECMILANIQAAAWLEEREVPTLYRVHAGPKSDRLEDLRAFLALRGLSLGGGEQPSALDYAALAQDISDLPDRSVIQTVMLRSMQQAVYQPKNEGHFGLALDQYAHFTSPIRRYPDLLVHRALKFTLQRGKRAEYPYSKEAMLSLGESCSMTERRAEEASRDVVSWLKCEYMQDHVGSEFPGVVSAVTSFGLFVDLVGIHVEGLVHITNLSHDYYRFDQAAQSLTGERTGKQYHLGDALVVKVAAVNLEERKIDFTEVEHSGSEVKKRKSGKKPAREINPEHRRQEKRRIKQQRRDNKRAALKEAKKLNTEDAVRQARVTVEVDDSGNVVTNKIRGSARSVAPVPAKSAAEKPAVKKSAGKKVTGKNIAGKKFTGKKVAGKKAAGKKKVSRNAKKLSGVETANTESTKKTTGKTNGKSTNTAAARLNTAKKTALRKKTGATAKKTGKTPSAGKTGSKPVDTASAKSVAKKAADRKKAKLDNGPPASKSKAIARKKSST